LLFNGEWACRDCLARDRIDKNLYFSINNPNLNHVFFITSGSGLMVTDGDTMPFDALCLLLVPARTVHGFSYTANASGWVLTVADAYMSELTAREPGFAGLFAAPCCLPSSTEDGLEGQLERLAQKLVWNAPGYAAAIEGYPQNDLLLYRREQTL
jgi:AraC family transcriptional activator of pobA